MTTLLAPARAAVDAPGGPRRAMLALARVEAGRLLRHPVTVVALLLYLGPWVYDLVRPDGDRHRVLHDEAIGLQVPAMLLLGGATLVAANLGALREYRHRTNVVSDLLVLPTAWRVGAFLLAVLANAALTLVVVAAQIGVLALLPGTASTPDPLEVLAAPVLVALFGAAGVLLATRLRSALAAPLVMVAFTVGGFVTLAAVAVRARWAVLLPTIFPDLPITVPGALVDRPSGRHVLYLAGLVALVAALALARARVTLPLLAAGLAVTVAAGAAQFVRDEGVAAARVTATVTPAAFQTCRAVDDVRYCPFDDFTPWVAGWDAVVRDVRRRVPPQRQIGPPLVVRQHVRADGYPLHGSVSGPEQHAAAAQAQHAADTAAGTPEAVAVGTAWGDPASEAVLAAAVAYRLVTGKAVAGTARQCGARGALIVWLAGQSSPRALAGVHDLDARSFGALAFSDTSIVPMLSVDDRDAAVGLALLTRPADEVAALVARHWTELTAATTTTDRAGEIFNVPVAPLPPVEERPTCDS